MATFKNAEIRQAGHIVRANVEGEVDSFVPLTGPSVTEWSGVLRPPNNTGLAVGETYFLQIPGHSPAKIEITGEANPVDGSVTFKGLGQLPASAKSPQIQSAQ